MSSITTKARYLGSLILPSPVEVDVTLFLYDDRIEIPELEATVYLDKVGKIRAIKGSQLPAQTLVMAGIVGLVIDKAKQYLMIEVKPYQRYGIAGNNDVTSPRQEVSAKSARDGMLLRFEDDGMASQFARETEKKRNIYLDAAT